MSQQLVQIRKLRTEPTFGPGQRAAEAHGRGRHRRIERLTVNLERADLEVVDDFLPPIPVSNRELEVVEAYLGTVLNEIWAKAKGDK